MSFLKSIAEMVPDEEIRDLMESSISDVLDNR